MPRLPIDTFHLIKRLQEAGFSPAQAEAQVEVLLELYALQETAKKKDVIKLRFLVKKDIALTQAKLRAELQEVEAKLRAELQEVEAKLRAELQEVEAKLSCAGN
jgi:DNA-binding transcriptional MerR regulator